jgi:ABC-type lipoprotein release transport system permease subunit
VVGNPKQAPPSTATGKQFAHVPQQRHALVAVEHPEGHEEDQREKISVKQRETVAEVQPQRNAQVLLQGGKAHAAASSTRVSRR